MQTHTQPAVALDSGTGNLCQSALHVCVSAYLCTTYRVRHGEKANNTNHALYGIFIRDIIIDCSRFYKGDHIDAAKSLRMMCYWTLSQYVKMRSRIIKCQCFPFIPLNLDACEQTVCMCASVRGC